MIWQERLELLRSGLGEDNSETLRTIEALAELYDAWGKPEQAAEWRAKAGQESDAG